MLTSTRWNDQVLDYTEVSHVDEEALCADFQFSAAPTHTPSKTKLTDARPKTGFHLDKHVLLWQLVADIVGHPRPGATLRERKSSCR